jgi:hypothetical protein
MRLAGAFLACCLLLLCPLRASAQDHVEVFGGYSFVHATMPITTGFGPCTGLPGCQENFLVTGNLNGWEVAGTLRPGTWFGITADFSGHYGTDAASNGHSSAHLNTYLIGPKIAHPGRVSPFFHVLAGAAHNWTGNGYEAIGTTIPSSQTAFAMAFGGDVDIKLKHSIAVRPIQFDYLLTRFNSSTQNEFRVSTGLVVRF